MGKNCHREIEKVSSPVISVVIPVFNAEEFIELAIESVMVQPVSEVEVLCINDGSTDGSWNKLQELQKKHSNLYIYNKENTGVSDTRNYGLSLAQGEFVLFLDADDEIYPDIFRVCLKHLKRFKADAILFNMVAVLPSGLKIKCFGNEHFKKSFLVTRPQNYSPAFNFTNAAPGLFRRQYLQEHSLLFKKGQLYEDWLFMVRFFVTNPKVIFLDKVFYAYRIQENGKSNITNNISSSCLDIFSSYLLADALIRNNFPSKEPLFINDKKILNESVSFVRNRLADHLDEEVAQEYLKSIKKISSRFDLLYLQSLLQTLPWEVRVTADLIRKKKVRSKYSIQLRCRYLYTLYSIRQVLRECKNILKNLCAIGLIYKRAVVNQNRKKKC